jgi:ADP-heptose:LPS heptosyltransferase
MMKLLAINFGGLGDEVLFLPTLKSIKTIYPDWEITLLTEPRSRSITQLSKLIDKNIVFDIKKVPLLPGDYLELISLLRAGKYDVVVSSGSSSKVCMLLYLSGIPRRIGYDSGTLSRLLLTRAVKLNKEQYAGLMYHDLVKGLDIDGCSQAPEIDLDPAALDGMRKFLESEGLEYRLEAGAPRGVVLANEGSSKRKLVLIHPGMSRMAVQKGIIKNWATDNWCELVRRLMELDHAVMLCGGPDDDDTIRDITAKLQGKIAQGKGKFINAYGKTGSVKDLVALMQLADLIVCVDSAPMHIAAALQKRLVALFGPTDPKKLLLESDRAVAIREKKEQAERSPIASSEPSVQIPLDIVYQTAVDQLSRASVQDSSLEFQKLQ